MWMRALCGSDTCGCVASEVLCSSVDMMRVPSRAILWSTRKSSPTLTRWGLEGSTQILLPFRRVASWMKSPFRQRTAAGYLTSLSSLCLRQLISQHVDWGSPRHGWMSSGRKQNDHKVYWHVCEGIFLLMCVCVCVGWQGPLEKMQFDFRGWGWGNRFQWKKQRGNGEFFAALLGFGGWTVAHFQFHN